MKSCTIRNQLWWTTSTSYHIKYHQPRVVLYHISLVWRHGSSSIDFTQIINVRSFIWFVTLPAFMNTMVIAFIKHTRFNCKGLNWTKKKSRLLWHHRRHLWSPRIHTSGCLHHAAISWIMSCGLLRSFSIEHNLHQNFVSMKSPVPFHLK